MRMSTGKDLHEYDVSTTETYVSLSTRTRTCPRTKILVVDKIDCYILHLIWCHIYFYITTVFVKVLCYIELSFK